MQTLMDAYHTKGHRSSLAMVCCCLQRPAQIDRRARSDERENVGNMRFLLLQRPRCAEVAVEARKRHPPEPTNRRQESTRLCACQPSNYRAALTESELQSPAQFSFTRPSNLLTHRRRSAGAQ